jgi:lysozyme
MKSILVAIAISFGMANPVASSPQMTPLTWTTPLSSHGEQFFYHGAQSGIKVLPDVVIDLSHHNDSVDFQTLAKNNIQGVIHKATEGGGLSVAGAPSFWDENYAAGFIDPKYKTRASEAAQADMLWGAYHFLRGGDGKKQADFFLKIAQDIEGNKRPLLFMLDVEITHTLRQPTLEQAQALVRQVSVFSKQSVLKIADDFIQEILDQTGVWPIVYGSPNILKAIIGNQTDTILKNCPLNIAHWKVGQPTVLAPWRDFTLWQYTSEGTVPGVNGYVDREKFNGLKNFWYIYPPSDYQL